ncbi:Fc.00g115580.m01.CDS01 [Cosmosporella sp. VM-42]
MMASDSTARMGSLKLLDWNNSAISISNAPVTTLNVTQAKFTDHMAMWEWDDVKGWKIPQIRPFGPLPIMPSASVLQYATECFEGIKIYRGYDGQLRLFRVQLNCQRMLESSLRVGLPAFDPAALQSILMQFGALEAEKWLPVDQVGRTLYLRPTHIGTTAALGVQKPRQSLLYVIATSLPGFTTKGNGMRLRTSPGGSVRAWPGGFGNRKLGGNYGPTLPAHDEAVQEGFDQVLWLSGEPGFVTEAGASNFFVVWRTREGDLQLITAGLDSETILEGIMRRSVLELVQTNYDRTSSWEFHGRSLPPLRAVEGVFSIDDLRTAKEECRLLEAFAAGTAYFVAPVEVIHHRGKDIQIPLPSPQTGSYALLIKKWLSDIVFGYNDPYGWTSIIQEPAAYE